MTKVNRIGEKNTNKQGLKMEITEYRRNDDITVKFENGYDCVSQYVLFQKGSIKNPYFRETQGIGYIGEGKYTPSINNKLTIQYKYWMSMFYRCYNEGYHKKENTYINCSVCKEWHNYQVFAEWFDNNYYEIENEVMQIDKDILHKGNKIYSPKTCVFVPRSINNLFVKNDKVRGKYPIGVTERNSGYQARLNKNTTKIKVRISLGVFATPKLAFDAYKVAKENYIKQVANDYKSKIPSNLYKAMIDYKVEITD